MSKKFKIGIPGWKLGDNSFGCGTNHLTFISKYGDPKILFPQDDDEDIDMLYLPGGPDVSPGSYGQIPGFNTGNSDLFRQYFFEKNLEKYIQKGTKIFGVCLGMQMLNIHFGGELTQHLRYHAQSRDRWEEGHYVHFPEGKSKFKVNSHHHQAVTQKDLSTEFIPLVYAVNEEDGENPIVEGIKHRTLPIVGVQWHPEEYYDKYSHTLIRNLLDS